MGMADVSQQRSPLQRTPEKPTPRNTKRGHASSRQDFRHRARLGGVMLATRLFPQHRWWTDEGFYESVCLVTNTHPSPQRPILVHSQPTVFPCRCLREGQAQNRPETELSSREPHPGVRPGSGMARHVGCTHLCLCLWETPCL